MGETGETGTATDRNRPHPRRAFVLPSAGRKVLAAARALQADMAAGVARRMLPLFRNAPLAVAVYSTAAFLSAALLFSLQPLFAKMVLPLLGGAASVWAVALCFFQGALLLGYAIAHGAITFLPPRWTGAVHAVLCLAAALTLPIGIPEGWSTPPPAPYLWQLALFTVAIGLPFTAAAANAPLLQAWFAATPHGRAREPYFLYAASNLGSLLALLSYPFLLEPLFGTTALSHFWAVGFLLLLAVLGFSFLFVLAGTAEGGRSAYTAPGEAAADKQSGDGTPSLAARWGGRCFWVWCAFVPAALLTAFTTHISTDIAPGPLLWVAPLALYLLSFVLAFRAWPPLAGQALAALHTAAVAGVLFFLAQTKHTGFRETALTGAMAFFIAALAVHQELYRARPGVRRLTEFYLCLAAGGALGGLFAALAAPLLFSEVYEYPLLLALTLTCRLALWRAPLRGPAEAWVAAALSGAGIFLLWQAVLGHTFGLEPGGWLDRFSGFNSGTWGMAPFLALIFAAAALLFLGRPLGQALMALLLCGTIIFLPSAIRRGEATRSYFGVYRVFQSDDGEFNVLTHGTTLHGAQRIRDEAGNAVADVAPATYYYPGSPMAKAIGIVRNTLKSQGTRGRYGVVGLGTGTLACWSEPGDVWRFFEIDPTVVNIAAKSGHFTYLANCQPEADIVLGDARLSLAKEPESSFALLIVDAFTSDAIPVHLMTAEALRLYFSRLAPGGVLVLHISNRYLDLENVLGATLDHLPGVHGLLVSDDAASGTYSETTSTVAVFAQSQDALDPFRALPGASEMPRGKLKAWTDDFSDIVGPYLSRARSP